MTIEYKEIPAKMVLTLAAHKECGGEMHPIPITRQDPHHHGILHRCNRCDYEKILPNVYPRPEIKREAE